ncbi:TonB-dependent receptor [Xanthovirga aplysinae]|uniref:TonB-dependent receptor n=1 Tax=Xanthovirga aplysinae TaxID=2529853 RepID=UPI0012BC18A0|nr:carboxypeptidase-like regulatory domain-containing protein [Xanthovirga aplysinae]MTI32687.1 TonB-dependent receptor [Xanthovirga aplysinae]
MIKKYSFLTFLLVLISISIKAQKRVYIQGNITNEKAEIIPGVFIKHPSTPNTTITDEKGNFSLSLSVKSGSAETLTFRHLQYKTFQKKFIYKGEDTLFFKIALQRDLKLLDTVEVKGNSYAERTNPAGITKISAKSAKNLPSAFSDFSKVLTTLPGVSSNNELSSAYSVRGGNYDENLVYINDILVYRPFLSRSGQQDGLSFVNSDLVSSIVFSAGGWGANYGDKLSSVLSINYKKPQRFGGSVNLGLLGGTLHLEGKKNKFHYLIGFRNKSAKYLFNTLPTKGQYLPRFTDLQTFFQYEINEKSSLEGLISFAQNNYEVFPDSQVTNFGTLDKSFRLTTDFEGHEVMTYSMLQGGLKFNHNFSDRFQTSFIVGGLNTSERESFDVEGYYRLADVDNNPVSNSFDEELEILGLGANYKHARNSLQAQIINLDNRSTYWLSSNSALEFGLGYSYEDIQDKINEYNFTDSAGYVNMSSQLATMLNLQSYRFRAYLQYETEFASNKQLTSGVRLNYWNINEQLLISPRISYTFKPTWNEKLRFKVASGIYQQAPFYRELRDEEGFLNKDIKAQSSFHFITGTTYDFQLWNRDFKLNIEAYYKYMWNVIPYQIEDMLIRYDAENKARAFASGIDIRVNGEFIEGTESWFSLGLLNTKEDIFDDDKGYIRRPSDQHLRLGVFFEDHLPNDPSLKVYLNLVYGSGLPFGPPNNADYRNAFTGRDYKRVDVGFFKSISFNKRNRLNKLKGFKLGLEVLNLLGVENVISYSWITDFSGVEYAVPNSLSQRFFNLRTMVEF